MFVNLKQLLEKLWNPGHIKEEQRGFFMSPDLFYGQKNVSKSHSCGNSVHRVICFLFTEIVPQKPLHVEH